MNIDFHRPPFYPKQFAAIYDPARYSLIEASTKAGKAQPLTALVYTPSGPVKMRDVVVGMDVLTPSGVAKVIGVYPQGVREVLCITFSDGQAVEADADHLWETHGFKTQGVQVVTTEQLQAWPAWKFKRTWVPSIGPAQFDARSVPIDPYLMGVLIGDGGLSGDSVMLSSADDEVLEAVRVALPAGHSLRYSTQYDWRITAGSGAAQLREDRLHIRGMIDRLGLGGKGSHEKFVPDIYRYNSTDVRWAVLQGLFDTDGSVDKHGQPVIEQTSERLARDITELVQSVGGSVLTRLKSISGYRATDGRFIQCRPVWRQRVRFPDATAFFRLKRKKDACKTKRKSGHRMFKSIEFARRAEMQCIAIDDPRGVYLTDGLIPTHNTSACIAWLTEKAFFGLDGFNYWWVAPVSEQARIAFDRTRRALGPDQCRAYQSPYRIALPHGPVIWFKSGDKPDSLYGEDVHAAVIDEASRLKQDAWYALRSTLTKTRGPARIIGNVHGRKNWFYRMARQAEQGFPDYAYHRLVAHDAVEAGVLSADEIEAARRELPEHVFRELYLAEASEDGGNPFGFDAIRRCTVPALYQGVPVVYGVDLAKSVDWNVVIGMTREGYVCSFDRWQHTPWEETENRILRIIGRTPTLVDCTGVGDPIVERLQKRTGGHPGAEGNQLEGYKFSDRSKQQLMEGLVTAIQSGGVTFPAGPITMELEQFTYEMRGKEGRFTGVAYSAPAGFHDDCVMALALAEMHRARAPRQTIVPAGLVAAIRAQSPSRRHMR